ncbi:MAG TPA: hypothetical protein VH352_28170 [Pseudonocardiaceae bacterium]|nr:hypothetical protein [Pseudonocardiaceae bacterium]
MTARIPDARVDALEIRPGSGQGRLVETVGDGSEGHMLLVSTLVAFPTSLAYYVASGVADREGIGKDESGFRYPTDELDPGEEPFDDVDVYNPLGAVFVSIPAFERLMARYLRCLATVATATHDAVIDAPWWPDFLGAVDIIEARVEPSTAL